VFWPGAKAAVTIATREAPNALSSVSTAPGDCAERIKPVTTASVPTIE
jgi:hypothetical protein